MGRGVGITQKREEAWAWWYTAYEARVTTMRLATALIVHLRSGLC